MKKTFTKIIIILISFLIINVSAAEVNITVEKLQEAAEKLNKEQETIKYAVDNSTINITAIDEYTNSTEKYKVYYDIENGTISFIANKEIKRGMSYNDYKKIVDSDTYSIYIYPLVARIYDVSFEDAYYYYMTAYSNSYSSQYIKTASAKHKYEVIEVAEGMTIDDYYFLENVTVIDSKDFGNYVIEYIEDRYPQMIIYEDNETLITNETGYSTYKYVFSAENQDENTTIIFEKFSINNVSNFSKIKGFEKKLDDAYTPEKIKNMTKENADYYVELQVGQKLIINSEKKGYRTVSTKYAFAELLNSENNQLIFLGKKEGVTKALFSFEEGVEKTLYIEVVPNTTDGGIKNIEINYGFQNNDEPNEKPNNDIKNETKKEEKNETENQTKKENPDTGIKISISVMSLLLISGVIGYIYLNKKKKFI